ncbi:ATP-binding protein [Cytobacillus firmus]|uniref:sensor histidine kinase n=1 Tax=Cytobacillus firmus TaxID=1399 RepID=UPI00077C5047|nr:HAMP domain-containing sensor histidine kinase [Cytobacillus firmus]MBG9542829.1 histidine kinase [Cytobacillus firmus]MBG9554288.1 histidine kinase [Cytobacillus firmus]MBG9557045.1 histidine kinase [Cytobacillus firmus]MBG9576551.1 histidine kinase [Cytobacillus firmus]MEC1891459.1 HAMP domain-containing sensor histidine kinase [Cytobacillus firmus]
MEITKHLFFNLSLLIVILFVVLVWAEKSSKFRFSKGCSFVWLLFMIWICFQFSFQTSPHYFFDLRLIPVIIGGLYAGVGLALAGSVILMRSFYGVEPGFYSNILLYLPLGIFLWKLYPWFWKQVPRKRIRFSVIITLILSVLTVMVMEICAPSQNRFDAWFAYLMIPPLGVFMITYVFEFAKRNLDMRENLVRTEKLEAVEQMGAAISHEIRNPLTAAIGFVQLMQEQRLPPRKRVEYLSIVKAELESAEQVIQNYLTFSKPSLDKIEEINVKKELMQVMNILKPTANQNSVEINAHFTLLGSIKGDRQKFHQCFLNVIKNSIEAMPRGGQLYIETHYNSSQITIEIKDTGVGMTPEQLQRLGEPYYSTKGSKGTGLGMMVVFSIVRAMDGHVRVKSEVDKGTVFSFTFPNYKSEIHKD